VEVLAIPVIDGISVKNLDDLVEELSKKQKVPITVMNDFDVPWVQQYKCKFPKLPKKKKTKKTDDADEQQGSDEEKEKSEEEPEEEEEEQDDEEKES